MNFIVSILYICIIFCEQFIFLLNIFCEQFIFLLNIFLPNRVLQKKATSLLRFSKNNFNCVGLRAVPSEYAKRIKKRKY